MRQPRTILDLLFGGAWIAQPKHRYPLFGVIFAICAIFTIFPREYLAITKLAPPGANVAGLQGAVGGVGVNGLGANWDVNLLIAESFLTEQEVARRLGLTGTPGYETPRRTSHTLRRLIEVRPLRGGLFAIRAVTRDPDFSLRLANAYGNVFRARVSVLGRQQASFKREFLRNRMTDATERLHAAQTALDAYRARNRLAAPEAQLGSAVGQLAGLQSALQGKRVELQSALRFSTPESLQVKGIVAQIESLRGQIEQFQRGARSQGDLTITGIAARSNEYINLQRDVAFSQLLFESYRTLVEGLTLEEMTADFNLLPIEPPYVEPTLYLHTPMLIALLLTVLVAGVAEMYIAGLPRDRIVATRARPMLRAAE